ncbi:MAG: glycogen/starch synthase [Flavobacteriales bacterium]|nr:glycogen/starch synthase [Flavobacteriales bacterium]
MQKTKVLYVTPEIVPFLPESEVSSTVRTLAQGVHERDKEIRIFMPRFGVINERRHQLHEVIRLSGMNLIVNDVDHPLIIKVASVPQARMQVYFIDNEEFFKRKRTYTDEDEKFFKDNDERAIFFCRGVVETVKKLGWTPDIVHCHGWMTGFLPLYLKKMYADDPHFSGAKIIYTPYADEFSGNLDAKLMDKLNFDNIPNEDVDFLKTPNALNLNKTGAQWADAISIGSETINSDLISYINDSGKPVLDYQTEETLVDTHQEFYEKVLSENGVLAG